MNKAHLITLLAAWWMFALPALAEETETTDSGLAFESCLNSCIKSSMQCEDGCGDKSCRLTCQDEGASCVEQC